jgi:sulfate permease, SulP family
VKLRGRVATVHAIRWPLHPSMPLSTVVASGIAGVIGGLLGAIWNISAAALIFSGPLASHVGQGIALGLVSAIVLNLAAAAGSSVPFACANSQQSLAIICAVMASSIVVSLTPRAPSEVLPTVIAILALSTFITGAFFLALGAFHLGRLVRFVPFPVIGGFLAGTGWLIVRGAEEVLTGIPLTRATLPQLTHGATSAHLAVGVLLASALLMTSRRYTHFLVMPGLLVASAGLFYLALALIGTPLVHAQAQGWLLGPITGSAAYPPLGWNALERINWPTLAGQVGSVATLMVVATIGLLLNVTGLEVAMEDDLDVDRELQVMGIGNMLTGVGGGFAGFHTLSTTLMAGKIGPVGRLVGLVAALVAATTLLLGINVLSYLPRFLLGGLLLFVGADLLLEWIYRGWYRMTRTDFASVILIVVVVGVWGLLQALVVGIGLGVLNFVITYSQTGAIKYELSGATYKSNVDRSFRQRKFLDEHGESICILALQGFLFFGTTGALLDHIRQRLADHRRRAVRFIVLDCRLVTGVDASIPLTFTKLRTLAGRQGLSVVLTGLTPTVYSSLVRGHAIDPAAGVFSVLPELDQGVELCENTILDLREDLRTEKRPLIDQLSDWIQPGSLAGRLMHYLERIELQAGVRLVQQGTPSDDFYLVESGKLSIQLDRTDGTSIHLRTIGAGALLGELGFYCESPRTASVDAMARSILYRMTREALAEMRGQEPALADAFTAVILRLLAERVATTNDTIAALMR